MLLLHESSRRERSMLRVLYQSDAHTPLVNPAILYSQAMSPPPVARDLSSRHFMALAIKVKLLHLVKPQATISQQWVDSFPV
jgi:hypothetical protein